MSFRLKNIAAACVPLALFAVTACGAEGGNAEAKPDGSAAASKGNSSEEPGDSENPADSGGGKASSGKGSSGAGSAGGSGGGTATGAAGGGGAGGAAPACSSKNSRMHFEPNQGIPQGDLTLKNTGKGSCAISGFPKVSVVHTNEGGGTALRLNEGQKNQGSPESHVLKPGEAISSHFNFKPVKACDTPPRTVNVDLNIPSGDWSLKVPDDHRTFLMCEGPITVSTWQRAVR
jgi:hypothetical protein